MQGKWDGREPQGFIGNSGADSQPKALSRKPNLVRPSHLVSTPPR